MREPQKSEVTFVVVFDGH